MAAPLHTKPEPACGCKDLKGSTRINGMQSNQPPLFDAGETESYIQSLRIVFHQQMESGRRKNALPLRSSYTVTKPTSSLLARNAHHQTREEARCINLLPHVSKYLSHTPPKTRLYVAATAASVATTSFALAGSSAALLCFPEIR
jgi:hypothetical protein